jgi:hypothetical protein
MRWMALLFLLGCDTRPAVTPYEAHTLQPFSMQVAEETCPSGYTIVHREYCRENSQLQSAVVLCNESEVK